MKIFAIMVIKDEVDIVRDSLLAAKQWADRIFVLDNGSTDGTWEIVRSMADSQIVAYKQDTRPFYDGIRAEVFNAFRHEAEDGDWWCFAFDADEFFIDNPRNFLEQVPSKYGLVALAALQYVITDKDVAEGNFGYANLRYVDTEPIIEYQFFRYRKRFKWHANWFYFPLNAGVLYPQYIALDHYKYRSPEQIQRRLDIRRAFNQANPKLFSHASQKTWQEKIVPVGEAIYVGASANEKLSVLRSLPQRRLRTNPVLNAILQLLIKLKIC